MFWLLVTGSAIAVNDLSTLSDEIATLWNANVAPLVDNTCILTKVDVTYIVSAGVELRYVGSYSHAGADSGVPIDNAASCAVVDFVISAYYRGGHPRLYQPGVETTWVTNGSAISSTRAASIVAAWNAIRNGINAFTTTNITGLTMGTVSFSRGNAWRVPPVFEAYTSVKIGKNSKLGSQRRRILT